MTEQNPGVPGGLAPGSRIAGYRLEEQIGLGGMSAVFRAYDERLDRLVALKVLAPALAGDEAFRQRFIRESRAAAAVDDPHIIPVFEAGESGGVLFIAMRLVRGGDVRTLVDRVGPLPAARAAEIISQAASALDAAHARGLVHRDVKPANMLLDASQSLDRPDHVYLSDFGLSKASLAMSGLTATGQFLGTLDYVAPEQIEGKPVDGRTDEYALACAAFELLCGEPPFRRNDSVSVMYAHLNDPPPLIRQRRGDLPDGVDQVVARGMAKLPGDRYATCRDFAAALRAALEVGGNGIESPPPPHPVTEIAAPVSRPVVPAQPPITAASEPPIPAASEPPAPAGAGQTVAAAQTSADLRRPHMAASAADRDQAGVTAPRQTEQFGLPAVGRRPWWRSPLPLAAVCAVVLIAGGGAYALAGRGHGAGPAGHGTQLAALPSVSLPPCTTRTARARALSDVSSATVATSGSPFGVAVTPDGQYSFVSTGNGLDVFRDSGSLAPTLVRSIGIHGVGKELTFTAHGKFLLAASGSGALIINVAEAIQGAPDPVTGQLTSPNGNGAFETLITAGNDYALVTLQNSAEMAVFNLKAALTQGASPSDFIGYVPLGNQPVGMASDGTWVYVANIGGTLSVVSLHAAETDPATAVAATVQVGCQPARALLSADGSVLWVSDRQSDELLAFLTARLRTDPLHALVAKVEVGEVPLSEVLVDGGSRIVVADSNLNGLKGAVTNLAVVDTASALAGKPALLGYVATGLLPRTIAVVPGGATLLVTVENSQELQAVRISNLP